MQSLLPSRRRHPSPGVPLPVPQSLPPGRLCTAVLLAQVAFVPIAGAQGSGTLVLPRLTGPIQLDGLSDEPAWEAVQPWQPTQYEPNNGAPPTERTEFLVAYDDTYVYFALRGYDSDSTGIRANTLYRDRLSGDDHFEILLDTFNDNETAVLFTTTPAGIRKDAAISNDASGGGITSGQWINGDFNTFWDVSTEVNGDGWFAEIRVPFTSLRFQDDDGRVVMGIILQRKVARKTERLVFPSVRPLADWAFLKPSLAQKVVLKGIRPHTPLYLTPYALTGLEQTFQLNETGTAYPREDDVKTEAGADLKYGITNNLTLDLTVNTDFAQVEADDQQVNLTRFSLFYPEKRQFFQERAGIFEFRTGGLSRLFHSRRIGLTDDGQPVRIYGGARLVGRWGGWDPQRATRSHPRTSGCSVCGVRCSMLTRTPVPCSRAASVWTAATTWHTGSTASCAWPGTTTSPSSGHRPSTTRRSMPAPSSPSIAGGSRSSSSAGAEADGATMPSSPGPGPNTIPASASRSGTTSPCWTTPSPIPGCRERPRH
jgi:hypothetical protein